MTSLFITELFFKVQKAGTTNQRHFVNICIMAKEGFFRSLFKSSDSPGEPQKSLAQLGRVVPDASRCVQCGICGYNCPIGIPVRDYAHRGLPVDDPRCITCGNCINVCPRGTLRWETESHSLVLNRFLLTANTNA